MPTSAHLGTGEMVEALYLGMAPSKVAVGLLVSIQLVDRVQRLHWLISGFAFLGIGVVCILLFIELHALWEVRWLGVLYGAFNGGVGAIETVIFAHFYGSRNLGKISGSATA